MLLLLHLYCHGTIYFFQASLSVVAVGVVVAQFGDVVASVEATA